LDHSDAERDTPPQQKCCHTTDGISPFSLWMFAVSTVVCCVQCCCCIQTFTSPHFGFIVNMHGDGKPDRRVLVYSFWPKANFLTYFPTITRHVHHWHKIVKNLQSKKIKKKRIFCFLWCYSATIGSYLPAFRHKQSVPSSSFKQSKIWVLRLTLEDWIDELSPNVGHKLSTYATWIPRKAQILCTPQRRREIKHDKAGLVHIT